MFVSVGALVTRTDGAITVELTTDAGHRGSFTVHDHLLPCVGAALHTPVVLTRTAVKPHKPTKKRMKQISVKQEEKIAKSHGGVRHKGSGNQPGYAGDVRVDGQYRIEAKYTSRKSYSVTRAELDKIRSECGVGEVPLFFIDFKEPESLRTEDAWVLVPRTEWEKHVETSDD